MRSNKSKPIFKVKQQRKRFIESACFNSFSADQVQYHSDYIIEEKRLRHNNYEKGTEVDDFRKQMRE